MNQGRLQPIVTSFTEGMGGSSWDCVWRQDFKLKGGFSSDQSVGVHAIPASKLASSSTYNRHNKRHRGKLGDQFLWVRIFKKGDFWNLGHVLITVGWGDSQREKVTLGNHSNPCKYVASFCWWMSLCSSLKHNVGHVGKRRGGREALLRYTIVGFGRQKVLFGERGTLVIKKKGGPRHSSYNSLKFLYSYGMFNGNKV